MNMLEYQLFFCNNNRSKSEEEKNSFGREQGQDWREELHKHLSKVRKELSRDDDRGRRYNTYGTYIPDNPEEHYKMLEASKTTRSNRSKRVVMASYF